MSTQAQQFFGTRGFRVAAITIAAVGALALAAYWFGTGLRADTPASVAASPAGSSLTAARESRLDDYYGRFSSMIAAAKAASLAAASRLDDYYGRLSNSSAAATSASLAALAQSRADFHAEQSAAAAASRAVALEQLAERWAPFYAGLDKAMTAAGARPSAGSASSVVGSSAADQFQWIKPEGIKPSETIGSATSQYQWIKPEGINPK